MTNRKDKKIRMSDEILKCPHCGGEATLRNTTVYGEGVPYYMTAQVVCVRCGASGKKVEIHDYLCDRSMEDGAMEAIQSWNHRTV